MRYGGGGWWSASATCAILRTGSIPANRAEAREASSRKEFIRFNKLALRGARESVVWLTGCESGRWGDALRRKHLLDEAEQLVRILTAIVVKTKGNT